MSYNYNSSTTNFLFTMVTKIKYLAYSTLIKNEILLNRLNSIVLKNLQNKFDFKGFWTIYFFFLVKKNQKSMHLIFLSLTKDIFVWITYLNINYIYIFSAEFKVSTLFKLRLAKKKHCLNYLYCRFIIFVLSIHCFQWHCRVISVRTILYLNNRLL